MGAEVPNEASPRPEGSRTLWTGQRHQIRRCVAPGTELEGP